MTNQDTMNDGDTKEVWGFQHSLNTPRNLQQTGLRGERTQSHRVPGGTPLGNPHATRVLESHRLSFWEELSPEQFPNIVYFLGLNCDDPLDMEKIFSISQFLWENNQWLPSQVFLTFSLLREKQKDTPPTEQLIRQLLSQGGEDLIAEKLKKYILDIWRLLLRSVNQGNSTTFSQILYVLTGVKVNSIDEAQDTFEYAIGLARKKLQERAAAQQTTVKPRNPAQRKGFAERYSPKQ